MTSPDKFNYHPAPEAPITEILAYSNGEKLDVYKAPGSRFGMGELSRHIDDNPLADDMGCVYVQTKRQAGNDLVRNKYYFTSDAIYDEIQHRGTPLGEVNLDDQNYDITIGETWHSPLGQLDGEVEAVVMPRFDGISPSTGNVRYLTSDVHPLQEGRKMIDLIAASRADA